MSKTTKDVQDKLRKMVFEAIQQGVTQPKDILEWLDDNGWPSELPALMTIQNVLKENSYHYVWGKWAKKDKDSNDL